MKIYIFCDITPCSPLRVNRSFEGIFRLHLQGKDDDAICSSETSVDVTDYTALSPGKYNSLFFKYTENDNRIF
jgi:hypothetical protein